jgi:nitrogen fixation/metabolism regulation signal transduction histidine kinase
MFISAFYFINITAESTSEINHNSEDSNSEAFSFLGFALFGIFIFFKIFGEILFEIFFSIPKIKWSLKWIIQSSNISFFISFILISIIWYIILRLFEAIKERSFKNKLTKKLVPFVFAIYSFVTVIWLICLLVFTFKMISI